MESEVETHGPDGPAPTKEDALADAEAILLAAYPAAVIKAKVIDAAAEALAERVYAAWHFGADGVWAMYDEA